MNDQHDGPHDGGVDEQLEARLAAMTTWTGSVEGEGGGPLVRALAVTANDAPAVVGTIGFWRGLSKRQIAAVLVVAAGGLLVAGMVVPSQRMNRVGTAAERHYAMAPSPPPSPPSDFTALKSVTPGNGVVSGVTGSAQGISAPLGSQRRNYDVSDGKPSSGDGGRSVEWRRVEAVPAYKPRQSEPEAGVTENDITQDQTPATRQIIRRAMVDVVASDVQVAFRKAQDLVKVELGEFVQESTLSGSGKAMTGRVVLRLDPSRLAEVMQATRGLGELAAEQTGGDDVTDRLTDLDAQIRNEQRVEKEMLELFDLRKDAPLKEVLDLREQLARVRGNIERMQASKSQMGRLVSLATLTLTIRPQPDVTIAPPVVEETPSFGARFSQEIGRSWDRATNNLVSSAGWAVETVIGGLPMWTVLGVTGFVIWRVVRKRQKKA